MSRRRVRPIEFPAEFIPFYLRPTTSVRISFRLQYVRCLSGFVSRSAVGVDWLVRDSPWCGMRDDRLASVRLGVIL